MNQNYCNRLATTVTQTVIESREREVEDREVTVYGTREGDKLTRRERKRERERERERTRKRRVYPFLE